MAEREDRVYRMVKDLKTELAFRKDVKWEDSHDLFIEAGGLLTILTAQLARAMMARAAALKQIDEKATNG